MIKLRVLLLALLFSNCMVQADSMPAEEAADAPLDPNDERSAIEIATCGDLFDLFAEATPEDGKDPVALAKAQDDVLYFVTWVHGYLSGLYGIDVKKRPMGREGVVTLINQMAEVCEPDESKLFLDAARELK
jgi:hypothetical protein